MSQKVGQVLADVSAPGSAHLATFFSVLGFVAVAVTVEPAAAAVRVCKPLVVGAIEKNVQEKAAKRAALASWFARSKVVGIAQPSWRLANNKRLRCEVVEGRYECIALGQPCTIKQVAPKPRLQPKGPSVSS
ncbi:MAG: hypothetical protein AAFV45_03455 [Pseudomonadota bacterium]